MNASTIPDHTAAVRAAMATYADQDTPPMRIMSTMLDLATALGAGQRDLSARLATLPLGDVEAVLLRAARKAFQEAAPDARRVQRWQRWSAVSAAATVALCALAMLVLSLWRTAPVVWDGADLARQCSANRFSVEGGVACEMRVWVVPPVVK